MSVEFTIESLKDYSSSMDKSLIDWANENPKYDMILKKNEDSKGLYVFGRGSIRGFGIKFEKKLLKNLVHIRINVFASSTDWEMLYSVISYLTQKLKFKLYKDGEPFDYKSITSEQFVEAGKQQWNLDCSIVDSLLSKEDYIKLPNWDIDVVIYKTQYEGMKKSPDFVILLTKYLQERAYRMMNSRRAGIIEVNSGRRISVWNFDDFITQKVDMVSIINPLDEKDYAFVEWDKFIESEYITYEAIPRDNKGESYFFVEGLPENMRPDIFLYFKGISIDMNSI